MASSASGEKDVSRTQTRQRSNHRHTPEQIRQLEEFFRDWPHPNENQRIRLSQETGLDTKQIKFWFQNKRNQYKANDAKAENDALREEIEKLRIENSVLKESLKSNKADANVVEESDASNHTTENLLKENTFLKQEVERLTNLLRYTLENHNIPQPSSSLLKDKFNFIEIERQHWDLPAVTNETTTSSYEIDENEKSLMIETAATAMQELIELWRADEFWVKKSSGNNEYYCLDVANYKKHFPKINLLDEGSNILIESSKDSAVVPIAASQLVDVFSDEGKWMDFFWTIVTKARAIATVETTYFSRPLQLMHTKQHAVSPLVTPREYIMIRCIQQLDSTTWAIMDVSYQCLNYEIKGGCNSLRCWKYPSGCIIKQSPNQTSHVTWIEHVQVVLDKHSPAVPFYDDSLCGFQAYSAVKWIIILQRICERHAYLLQPATDRSQNEPDDDGVITGDEGRKRVMELSKRMVMKFCQTFCVSEKIEYPQPHQPEDNLHFYGRNSNTHDQGEPVGPVLCVVTSIWLPIPYGKLFNILKDKDIRAQWDCLAHGNPVNELTHISTGSHPGDNITLLLPYGPKPNNMVILEESFIDTSSAFVVYSPMGLSDIKTVINGEEDGAQLPILSSGFAMCSDGSDEQQRVDGASSSTRSNGGCYLTVILQLHDPDKEYMATARSLMDFIVERIKKVVGHAH